MGNPYFNQTYNSGNNEEQLYKDATDEICESRGIDFKYIPKVLVKPDHIFGEDTLKEFTTARDVTMLIESYENYDGVGDLFSKFGFEVDNRLILIIGTDRFTTYTDQDEPYIDDLIYHENSKKIFKVLHIEFDENFFQMNGGRDRYRLTTEIFAPSHEEFDTNIEDVDMFNTIEDSNNSLEQDDFDESIEDILDLSEDDVFGNL